MVLSRVSAKPVFGHYAVQVALADHLEEPLALAFHVVHIEHAVTARSNQFAQAAFAPDQRQFAQVASIEPSHRGIRAESEQHDAVIRGLQGRVEQESQERKAALDSERSERASFKTR